MGQARKCPHIQPGVFEHETRLNWVNRNTPRRVQPYVRSGDAGVRPLKYGKSKKVLAQPVGWVLAYNHQVGVDKEGYACTREPLDTKSKSVTHRQAHKLRDMEDQETKQLF